MKSKIKKIEYWTNVVGLTEIVEARPTLYKNVRPDWWKSLPSDNPIMTAKNCPSFSDVFSSAYVLRMWCDSYIRKTGYGEFSWETSSNKFSWSSHPNEQMISFLPEWMKKKVWAVGKPISPWFAKTPKGYSIYQMPLPFGENKNFSAIQGIINTDFYHSINPPLFFLSGEDEFEIKLGTPLAIHIPFKREKINLEVREATKNDIYLQEKTMVLAKSKFKNSYRNFMKNLNDV